MECNSAAPIWFTVKIGCHDISEPPFKTKKLNISSGHRVKLNQLYMCFVE